MEEQGNPATERQELIKRLQEVRGGRRVITYVTSSRPGGGGLGYMGPDAIPVIYRHLQSLGLSTADKQPLDLFLHTLGGENTVPWRLMSLLREYASDVALLVPHYAFSAGTLAALGADKVIMHPMGVLGPTDTSVTGSYNPVWTDKRPKPIAVEDVRSYIEWVKEDVGIRHEDELVQALGFLAGDRVHPLALGLVKRSVLQSRLMGEKLLKLRDPKLTDHDIEDLVEGLAARLFYHGHPINRKEARDDLKLEWVDDAAAEVADAMWELYSAYDREMELSKEFSPLMVSIEANGGLPERPVYTSPGEPAPTVAEVELDLPIVCIESEPRRDWQTEHWTSTILRQGDGSAEVHYVVESSCWEQR